MIEKNILIESFKNMRKIQKKEFIDLLLKEITDNYRLTIEEDISYDKQIPDREKATPKHAFSSRNDSLTEEQIEFLIKRELKLQRIEQMFKGIVDLTELAELVSEDE